MGLLWGEVGGIICLALDTTLVGLFISGFAEFIFFLNFNPKSLFKCHKFRM